MFKRTYPAAPRHRTAGFEFDRDLSEKQQVSRILNKLTRLRTVTEFLK
jgi:hypothetical protein